MLLISNFSLPSREHARTLILRILSMMSRSLSKPFRVLILERHFLPVCGFLTRPSSPAATPLRVRRPCCVLRPRCRIVVAHGNAVRTSSVERYKNRSSSKTFLRIEDFCGEGRWGRGDRIEGPFDRRSAVASSAADLGRSVLLFFLVRRDWLVDQVWIRPQVHSPISGIRCAGESNV